ncbi:MAG: hypothetical protein LUE88_01410 [Clostridiales bacterium]|nr:hypothetical protein [Clostridiales bacterium]
MSVSEQITRLQGLRNNLRTKLAAMGIAELTANLDDCVAAVEGIADNGAVSQKLTASQNSYTVPAGYHNGGGTVSIDTEERVLTANGEYTPTTGKVISKVTVSVNNAPNLQEKSITPTKSAQSVLPDEGYDGLSSVTVGAIQESYADVANVSASSADVLANKIFVDSTGAETAGTMVNNGAVSASIDGLTVMSYTIPEGYHSGLGTVSLSGDIETALAAI